jgi:hypothetical protein
MAYAPHNNDNVHHQLRCGQVPSDLPIILGQFREADHGMVFEFAERRWPDDTFASDMPHVIYVGKDAEPRLAKVLRTVAFVVIDEDADGQPVIERWEIKGCRAYDTAWIRA